MKATLGSALLLVVPVWAAALAMLGPDTLAVAHSAPKGGRRAGFACAAGVAAGMAAWYAAVALAVTRPPVAAAYARAERGLTGATGALLAGLGARFAWQEAR